MAKASEARTYEESLAWLRDHGFDTTDAPGTAARVFLRKYNVRRLSRRPARMESRSLPSLDAWSEARFRSW